MRNLKYLIVCVLLMPLFNGCNNSNYHKTPIQDWMDKNLNDKSSYEPMEFIVIDSTNLMEYNPKLANTYAQLANVIIRKMNLVSDLFEKIESSELDLIKSEVLNNKDKVMHLNNSIYNFQEEFELNEKIDNEILKFFTNNSDSKNMDILQLGAQFEGTNNRIVNEKEKLIDTLKEMGTSILGIKSDVSNGLFIYHKYRANNSFGGKILKESLFKLSASKKTVEAVFDLQIEGVH